LQTKLKQINVFLVFYKIFLFWQRGTTLSIIAADFINYSSYDYAIFHSLLKVA
jgi:hypothetical protein